MSNGEVDEPRGRVYHPSGGEKKTKESESAACDINVIVDKWLKKGILPLTTARPKYGDFSNAGDYLEACTRLQTAEAEFLRVPAKVRRACDHDLGKFVEKCQTQEGLEELLELGLDPTYAPASAGEGQVAGSGEGGTPEPPPDPS